MFRSVHGPISPLPDLVLHALDALRNRLQAPAPSFDAGVANMQQTARGLLPFTGACRRRAWTAEQKAQILAESYESGEKVSPVARRHELTPRQLFDWRRNERQPAVTRLQAADRGGVRAARRSRR
jgi:transposase